jgi:hypothetical protein
MLTCGEEAIKTAPSIGCRNFLVWICTHRLLTRTNLIGHKPETPKKKATLTNCQKIKNIKKLAPDITGNYD